MNKIVPWKPEDFISFKPEIDAEELVLLGTAFIVADEFVAIAKTKTAATNWKKG